MENADKVAQANGLTVTELSALEKHGLTESAIEKAAKVGLEAKSIWLLTMQFGPHVIPILLALLMALKPVASVTGTTQADIKKGPAKKEE